MRTMLATCLLLAGCTSEPSAGSTTTALGSTRPNVSTVPPIGLKFMPDSQNATNAFADGSQALGSNHIDTLQFALDSDGACRAALPVTATAALQRWNPRFRLNDSRDYDSIDVRACDRNTKNAPFATSGDWNGDGAADLMLHGSDGSTDYLVALMAVDRMLRQFIVSVLYDQPVWSSERTSPRFPDSYMITQAPYRFSACTEELEFDITTESVAIGLSDKGGATVYYLVSGVWKSIYAGC